MGGASAWHLAAHYADRWFASNPGAGFAESRRFLRLNERQVAETPWYERKLWRLYDVPDWSANLLSVPIVAYSGEKDGQKQAADVMAESLREWGVELTHVIGPDTEHRYEPGAAAEVERRMAALAVRGRDRDPRSLRFVTYTLRYDRMDWLTVDALGQHWERASVSGLVERDLVALQTENVTALTVDFPPGSELTPVSGPMVVKVDGQEIRGPLVGSDRSWKLSIHREGDDWKAGPLPQDGPRKKHGLQGPIDDAFLDSFLFVVPGDTCRSAEVQKWVEAESGRAIEQWRRQFRGEPRVKKDVDVTEQDVATSHIVAWGDPLSNAYLRTIVDRLPIGWGPEKIRVGDREFDAAHHAAIVICPNPKNPERYLVINSGPTQREFDYLNNARQTPKLPDWAVVDVTTPPDARGPGKVVAADFFGERWELRPAGNPEQTP